MDGLLSALEASAIAQYLRTARWSYAAVNAAHILGIALLIGAIVPLDLRMLGVWRRASRDDLARVLVPVAASGLALAGVTGLLLFSVRAVEYSTNQLLWLKLAGILCGVASAVTLHAVHGWLFRDADDRTCRRHALISIAAWTCALACGRLIAFTGGS